MTNDSLRDLLERQRSEIISAHLSGPLMEALETDRAPMDTQGRTPAQRVGLRLSEQSANGAPAEDAFVHLDLCRQLDERMLRRAHDRTSAAVSALYTLRQNAMRKVQHQLGGVPDARTLLAATIEAEPDLFGSAGELAALQATGAVEAAAEHPHLFDQGTRWPS